MSADLKLLAAGNTAAEQLLDGAYEQLSGIDLEQLLLVHAQPALFTVGMAECLFLAMQLDDAVARWKVWQNDQAEFRHRFGDDWTADQVNAEILAVLFTLVTGRHPCSRSLNGNLAAGLAAIHPGVHRLAGRYFCEPCFDAGTVRLLRKIARAS